MFFDFQKFYKFKIPKKSIFIDVGSNNGDWSLKISKKYKDCKIYAIEPIRGITRKNKNIKLFNFAIDKKNKKKVNFFITRKNVTSSLLNQNRSIINKFKTFKAKNGLIHKKEDYDVTSKIFVETITLKKFCKMNKIKKIHYLKIDAEGNDLVVLKSLGNFIKNLWGFELETWNQKNTLWKKQLWLDDCLKFIKKNKFSIVHKIIHGKGKTTDLICVNNKFLKQK